MRRKKRKKYALVVSVLTLSLCLALRFMTVQPNWPQKPRPIYDCHAAVEEAWEEDSFDPVAKLISCDAVEQINAAYMKDIKPVLEAKCLVCHGYSERVPLYAIVPPISFLVQHDIKDGRKHLDISSGFPFAGHHTQEEIFEDLTEVIQGNDMPPRYYRLAHWRSGLSPEESKKVLQWIAESMARLKG